MNSITARIAVPPLLVLAAWTAVRGQAAVDPALPTVAPGLDVKLFATEPLVPNPAAMAFDRRGRLFVGQGPQYRNPTPETPGDSVVILIDSNGDGVADASTTFASGLNSIQGLAWHGRDLWIGNSPDLTVVRDLDGDDVADEYVKVYTDLGNLEHANHGHTWAPDGKLYFSQGTSKGLTLPGRVAPKPFRDLWDVRAPVGTPDFPPPQVFKRDEYKATYQDPRDNWGREGGVLRCDDMGANLEIVSRGFRNPWDIAFDSGFNWLGTDNDQSDGDRLFMPFFGAHFGWGHVWSNHWTVKLTPGIKPATVRFTLDGSEPTPTSRSGSPGRLSDTTTLKAALFVGGQKVGNTLVGTYRKRTSTLSLPALGKVDTPTTAAQVLPLLAAADATRGPGLFRAAGCAACHRAGDEGPSVGPDLSTIGDRDDADSIIRSILNPNQIVVEGYGLLTVSTHDGNGFAGIFESETDRTLKMVQLNGEAVAIEKITIDSRRSIHESPMPPYDVVLTPRDVADLVSWLMKRSAGALGAGAATGAVQTPQRAPQGGGFTWELQRDRLSILHAGRPVTDYVFVDFQILRPYFQNVRAPSGAQVTRTHPPAAGDAADHATMHPGVWLAFGDINGDDFWRNKARIEHVAFLPEPSIVQGRLVFATQSRLVGGDVTPLATLSSRFDIAPWGDHAFVLTWEAEIRGDRGELVFGDQEEMGLGVRVATELTEQKGGLVVNSDAVKGAKTVWGNTAAWAAYSREIDGRLRGVAIFPAASNPNPTWWHSRDYGVIVANGFGKRAMPRSADGRLVVKSGEPLKLRYDVLLFDTPSASPIDFAEAYRRLQSDLRPAR